MRAVCQLWHMHSVPLKTRARFWVGFHAREDHFFETELRRLRHLDERLRQVWPQPDFRYTWCMLHGCSTSSVLAQSSSGACCCALSVRTLK